jgi:hypothetical protein
VAHAKAAEISFETEGMLPLVSRRFSASVIADPFSTVRPRQHAHPADLTRHNNTSRSNTPIKI